MHVRFGNRGFRNLALEFQKLLKDKKSLNMAPLQGAIPFSTFIFLFSFVLDLTYVNSLFIVIFAKVCLYLGLTSMIQQITNELIRTTRISYRFQGTNSGFKSYFSQDRKKCDVKGRDCIEKKSNATFNCQTSCQESHANIPFQSTDRHRLHLSWILMNERRPRLVISNQYQSCLIFVD